MQQYAPTQTKATPDFLCPLTQAGELYTEISISVVTVKPPRPFPKPMSPVLNTHQTQHVEVVGRVCSGELADCRFAAQVNSPRHEVGGIACEVDRACLEDNH
jgi:hypothetical protein